MAKQTLGQFLVNDALPAAHRGDARLDKKELGRRLVALARENPSQYAAVSAKLKNLGDEFSTLEGISVGLDDVAPAYTARNKIMHPAVAAMNAAKTDAEREKIILETQDKLTEHTKSHPGTLTAMALSGARGNIPQLLKTVTSPVASLDSRGRITPWLISKSYSEGLSLPDFWVAGNEARQNTVTSVTSVAEPGDIAKIFANNMYPHTVTATDCGTANGIAMDASDPHLRGRLLSKDQHGLKRDTIISAQVLRVLKSAGGPVFVRSPLTCESAGVCAKCMGADSLDQLNSVGVNVGLRAAQALAEPLTQMSLSAKHGVRVLKGASKTVDGVKGVRQLIEVPESFAHKATLAEETGSVSKITKAPHGGHYITVNGTDHYAGPSLELLVRVGQHVEAGDALTDGIPKPDEVVRHKGLGAGRKYFADQLYQTYDRSGANLDKRHFELMARADLSHVRVLETSEHHPELTRGDIVHYNQLRTVLGKDTQTLALDKAVNHVLGKEALHFTAGTVLTPQVVAALKYAGIREVTVAKNPPHTEALMKPMTRAPQLNPDWLARMAFRFLKDTALKGAQYGQTSDLHSTHPVPAYAAGAEFGLGADGRY